MPEVGKWNSHTFVVSPNVIRSFTGLTIKGSSETEDKETGGQKYVSRKSGKPAEISLTVLLSALTGNDVRNEALAFVDEARRGSQGYFYVGGKKLVTCQLMLTDASISETQIASNGVWVGCKVQLTFKQSGKYDGESGGSSNGGGSSGRSSGGSKKTSVKKKTTTSSGILSAVKGAVTGAISAAKKAISAVGAIAGISKAVSTIKRITNNAKKQSKTTKKKTTPAKKVVPAKKSNKVMRLLK
jgi:hypothetical protein|nr:MAG TPA: hypothetical protein [Caudoviricetes sp.]